MRSPKFCAFLFPLLLSIFTFFFSLGGSWPWASHGSFCVSHRGLQRRGPGAGGPTEGEGGPRGESKHRTHKQQALTSKHPQAPTSTHTHENVAQVKNLAQVELGLSTIGLSRNLPESNMASAHPL